LPKKKQLENATTIVRGKHEVLVHKPSHYHNVGFFVLNKPLEKVLLGALQTMRCIICHVTKQVQSSNNTIHECKGLLTYNPMHGITSMEKHINNEHKAIVAKYALYRKKLHEDEVSNQGCE
jgi:hypothetical protein